MKTWFGKEVKIGLSVLIGVVALYMGINYLKGINLLNPTNSYYVCFPGVGGLSTSAPVTIDGFQVGTVQNIAYDYENNGAIKVTLNLDKKLKIPVGSKACLEKDMFGTATVDLQLNPHVSEYCEKGAELRGEVKLGLMQTVKEELLPQVGEILPKVDTVLTGLQVIVNDPALAASIKRLDKITTDLEQTSAQLSLLMNNNVPVILENVEEVTTQINQFSGTLNTLPLSETMSVVQQAATNLRDITNRMDTTDNTLGLLLRDRWLYDRATGVLVSADSLLIDMRKNPKRYLHFSVF